MQEKILEAMNWRYAVKVFDPSKKITEEELKIVLETGRLSPSAIGIEPWKFIVVESTELRQKLRAASYDQPKVTDAAYLIIIARRTDVRANIAKELIERTAEIQNVKPEDLDPLKQMAEGGIARMDDHALDAWAKAQTYIPLGIMIETAALMGIDAGPMEGFSNEQVDAILGLKEKNLASTTMLTLGYRGEDPAAKRLKVRRKFEDVVEFVK
jgi:nitroreductase